LQTYANGLNSIVSCASLVMIEPFNGSCFEHALSKVCQYVATDEKVATYCFTHLYKSQNWHLELHYLAKEVWKRTQTWDKTYIDYGLRSRKLSKPVNTSFNILLFILLWSVSWVANYAKGNGHLINVVLIWFCFCS
jgi:hypothetical protein